MLKNSKFPREIELIEENDDAEKNSDDNCLIFDKNVEYAGARTHAGAVPDRSALLLLRGPFDFLLLFEDSTNVELLSTEVLKDSTKVLKDNKEIEILKENIRHNTKITNVIFFYDEGRKENKIKEKKEKPKKVNPLNMQVKELIAVLDELAKGTYYFQGGTFALWNKHFKTLLQKGPYTQDQIAEALANFNQAGYPLDNANLFMSVVNNAVRHTLRPYDKLKWQQKYDVNAPTSKIEQAEQNGIGIVAKKNPLEVLLT